MSIAAIARTFELDLPSLTKWLLVALADHADHEGKNVYPSIAHLCAKTGMGESTVRRGLRDLVARGLITEDGTTTGGVTKWRLQIGVLEEHPSAARPHTKPCPPKLKAELILMFDRTCAYCGGQGDDANGPDGRPWSVDRVKPGRDGGRYEPENIALACWICNVRKRERTAATNVQTLADRRGAWQTPPTLGLTDTPRGAWQTPPGVPRRHPEPSIVPVPESSGVHRGKTNGGAGMRGDPARPPTEREIARSQKATIDALWRDFVGGRKKRFGAAARHTDSIGKRAFAARVPAAYERGCTESDMREAVRRLAEDDKQPSPWYLDDRAAAAKADREEREASERKLRDRAEEERTSRANASIRSDAENLVHIDRVREASGLARTGNASLDRMMDGLASRTDLPSVGT